MIVARLRHVTSGAVVDVPEEKVERLGSEWEPAADEKKAAAPRRSTAEKK